jgi:signal transduction histidine kinase/CheY-like chemotaxis protein
MAAEKLIFFYQLTQKILEKFVFVFLFLIAFGCLFSCHTNPSREPQNHDVYLDSVYQYFEKNRDDAVSYLDSVYTLILNPGQRDLFRKYYFLWLVNAEVYKDYSTCLLYADSAIELVQHGNNKDEYQSEYAKAYLMKGDIFFTQHKFSEAIQYYYLGKQAMIGVSDSCLLFEYTKRLAKVLYDQGKYSEAAQYFNQCVNQVSYCGQIGYRVQHQQRCLDNVGLCYYHLGLYDSAMYYYRAAESVINQNVEHFRSQQLSEAALAVVYGNMGDIYYLRGDTTNAGKLFRKSIELNVKKNRDNRDAQLTMIKLGKMYLESGRFDKAEKTLNAVRLSMDTLPNEIAEGRWWPLQKRYYDTTHQVEKGYAHLTQYLQVLDSLKRIDPVSGFDINNEYNNIKRTYDLNLLKKQNQLKNIYLIIAVLFSLMTSIIIVLIWVNHKRSKRNEKELIEAKVTAEEAASAKQQFLSNMSHEIRTPMNAVIGITHLLLQDQLNPEQEANIRTLKVASTNLMSLLNDVLDYNKIDAGKIVFEEIDFSVHDLMNSIVLGHIHTAEEKGIGIRCDIDDRIPELLIGDPIRLTQVINNLVSNAIKFTHMGSVKLSAKLVVLNKDSVGINWEVTDTGIGIEPEHQDAIFESFTQASSETTRKFGGSGLGLTITKRLLELQGSEIKLLSKKNDGSTFSFDLTLKLSHKSKSELTQAYAGIVVDTYDLSPYKVLVVDDNEMNIQVLLKLLSRWSLKADAVTSGQKALDHIMANNYNLVLLDLQMPEMSGYEVAQQIRLFTNMQKASIPIIAITADVMPETRENAINSGMNDYVSKPFNPTELYGKVISLLAKESKLE